MKERLKNAAPPDTRSINVLPHETARSGPGNIATPNCFFRRRSRRGGRFWPRVVDLLVLLGFGCPESSACLPPGGRQVGTVRNPWWTTGCEFFLRVGFCFVRRRTNSVTEKLVDTLLFNATEDEFCYRKTCLTRNVAIIRPPFLPSGLSVAEIGLEIKEKEQSSENEERGRTGSNFDEFLMPFFGKDQRKDFG